MDNISDETSVQRANRLRSAGYLLPDEAAKMKAEVNRLRAELERREHLTVSHDLEQKVIIARLRAENEKLTGIVAASIITDEQLRIAEAEIDRLRADNAKLWACVEWYALAPTQYDQGERARAALTRRER